MIQTAPTRRQAWPWTSRNRTGKVLTDKVEVTDVKAKWLETLADLNVCSQKGLVEMFDGSIGAGSVFMPHGGQSQMTETQAMVANILCRKGTATQ